MLAADFEDMDSGANHPVLGSTDVCDGQWHHGAVSYDGSTWRLYVDATLDAELDTGGATPRYDSVQHFALGSALNSAGTPEGAFRGAIDEVRVWSQVRSEAQIQAAANQPLDVGEGLLAAWHLDEGAGEDAVDAVWGLTGALVGASWAGQAPFDVDLPPADPLLQEPEDGATGVDLAPLLAVWVEDPEGGELEVTFQARAQTAAAADFTLAMLPDTQYYCAERYDGLAEMFSAQTSWIVQERQTWNTAYVAHVGDIVDSGDDEPDQWLVADAAMSLLEDPDTTGLADGIPYGVAVGNHDQSPNGDPDGTTTNFNAWFGVERFQGRAYYGGPFGGDDTSNDNHYDLFSAGGLDFIVLYLEYDDEQDADVLAQASDLLDQYADRRAILVSHHLLETSGAFSQQGELVYEGLKQHANLFLMLCGHLTDEVWREDTCEGHTVYTVMADYQFDGNGGDGWMRLFTFSPAEAAIHAQTYSPWLDEWQDDADSDFWLDYSMGGADWETLGTVTVASGERAELVWDGLDADSAYEWRVQVSDGAHTVEGPAWSFTTGDGGDSPGDSGDSPGDSGDSPGDSGLHTPGGGDVEPGGCGCAHGRAGGLGLAWLLAGVGLARRRLRQQGAC